ncbi:uncharacterized protein LOC127259465 [Andrographis paniculata]|uniref:uncharacterized protein LOC127259465 n=1 Tax=Andrographis paniculata TaxID=175694 RepID=UPI0021E80762|nr:uncharacterized protein LOC127259465 [Andrographis paniculata]
MEGLCFDAPSYSEYMDDLNYSQGFYVTPSKDGSSMVGAIRRAGECSAASEHYVRAERAARFAVEEHNNAAEGETGLPLKFVSIVNLNLQPSAKVIYYITMEVVDTAGEKSHYQAKVRENLCSSYRVYIFRSAPYNLKSADKTEKNLCCTVVDNLLPWMDESYLYYKAFYKIKHEILGIEVMRNENRGVLWFKNREESKKLLKSYIGKVMPCTNMSREFALISN